MALVNCGFWLLLIFSVRACCRERNSGGGSGEGRGEVMSATVCGRYQYRLYIHKKQGVGGGGGGESMQEEVVMGV